MNFSPADEVELVRLALEHSSVSENEKWLEEITENCNSTASAVSISFYSSVEFSICIQVHNTYCSFCFFFSSRVEWSHFVINTAN